LESPGLSQSKIKIIDIPIKSFAKQFYLYPNLLRNKTFISISQKENPGCSNASSIKTSIFSRGTSPSTACAGAKM